MPVGSNVSGQRASRGAEAYLAELDLPELATRICAAVPSLRTVVLTLQGVRGRPFATFQHGPDCKDFRLYAKTLAVVAGMGPRPPRGEEEESSTRRP